MIWKLFAKIFKKIAALYGYRFVPEVALFDFQKGAMLQPKKREDKIPPSASKHLQADNPQLIDYQNRYATFDERVITPLLWTSDRLSTERMPFFRGHNAFVYQIGSQNRNIIGYTLEAYYIKLNDNLNLWNKLEEEGDFGAILHEVDHKTVSRDLLDSIMEINFLEHQINISSQREFSILDIGAGYGRLAYRMINALPNLHQYLCTDAVPISTFISEYYLKHKEVEDKAQVIPLDMIEEEMKNHSIDLALNIHSFSECTLSAIDWWLSLLEEHQVRYLLIVPNSGKRLLTNDKKSFQGLVEEKGYRLKTLEPKYKDPVLQKYAANPSYYHLYELV